MMGRRQLREPGNGLACCGAVRAGKPSTRRELACTMLEALLLWPKHGWDITIASSTNGLVLSKNTNRASRWAGGNSGCDGGRA